MVIDPKTEEDKECFKWVALMALHHNSIDSHPELISNLRRFQHGCDWSGLMFPIALNKIKVFKWKNDVFVNALGVSGEKLCS